MLNLKNIKRVDISKLPKLNSDELKDFKSICSKDSRFNLMINELYNKKIIDNKNYTIEHSSKISGENYKIPLVIFSFKKAFIISIKLGYNFLFLAVQSVKRKNKLFLNIYNIKNNSLNLIDRIRYHNISHKSLNILVPKKLEIIIHGNWCGPGHSGPATPIDNIDKCCQKHDYCYKSAGDGSKVHCDMNLISCLEEQYNYSSTYGKMLIHIIVSFFTLVDKQL